MLNVDYVVSGSVRRNGRKLSRERRAHRNAHRAHRLGRECSTRRHDDALAGARRDRQPHRRVGGARNRNGRAQSRHPEAAELARRLGSAPSRPVAHVPLQQDRQRARAPVLRAGRASSIRRSRAPTRDCRSRISRTRFSAGRRPRPKSTAPSTPRARASWSTTAIRRRTGRWAARMWLRGEQDQAVIGAGTRGGSLAELRDRPLHARVRAFAVGRSEARRSRSRIIRASCRRSIRCCSRCWARAP